MFLNKIEDYFNNTDHAFEAQFQFDEHYDSGYFDGYDTSRNIDGSLVLMPNLKGNKWS